MSGKVITIDVAGQVHTCTHHTRGPPEYGLLKRQVGGWIQGIKIRYEGKIRQAYVHEEGFIRRLPLNKEATRLLKETYPTEHTQDLVGPLVIWVPDKKGART